MLKILAYHIFAYQKYSYLYPDMNLGSSDYVDRTLPEVLLHLFPKVGFDEIQERNLC